jgi:glutamate transport system permease protein
VAEVLRSGVNAVPKGQREAALSLGMRERSVFLKVIFPQAIRYVIPALISEIVIVVKDTTFAYVVNYPDLMQNARVLISNYDALLSVYLIVAVIYILINYLLNRVSQAVSGRRKRSAQQSRQSEDVTLDQILGSE